jgi:hypothetical protein
MFGTDAGNLGSGDRPVVLCGKVLVPLIGKSLKFINISLRLTVYQGA